MQEYKFFCYIYSVNFNHNSRNAEKKIFRSNERKQT